jgi:hypothetical protein
MDQRHPAATGLQICPLAAYPGELLCLPPTVRGRDAVTEKDLRPIEAVPSWRKQRLSWAHWWKCRGGKKNMGYVQHSSFPPQREPSS